MATRRVRLEVEVAQEHPGWRYSRLRIGDHVIQVSSQGICPALDDPILSLLVGDPVLCHESAAEAPIRLGIDHAADELVRHGVVEFGI